MSSIIYKSTNIYNGKAYIGFTTNFTRRKREHLLSARNLSQCMFHQALRKYGEDAFRWECLYKHWDDEFCYTIMEPLFIQTFDTYRHGYNMTQGGDSKSIELRERVSASMKLVAPRGHNHKDSKRWTLRDPNGVIYEDVCLRPFCHARNLMPNPLQYNARSIKRGPVARGPWKGWEVLEVKQR